MVQWLRQMANGRGFKPWHRILDRCERFASYYIKEKLKLKVAKWGTSKKYFFLINKTSLPSFELSE